MRIIAIVFCFFMLISCTFSTDHLNESTAESTDMQLFKGESPWPDIRAKRIRELLPQAMKSTTAEAWLIVCRENNNDPISEHIGGENAGGEAAFLFYFEGMDLHSIVFSPVGEATALKDLNLHDSIVSFQKNAFALKLATEFIRSKSIKKLAVNKSTENSLADGLSATQYQRLVKHFEDYTIEFISSEEIIYEWLSIKLPEEVAILKQAAQLTADWQIEAYQNVVPGQTTDADIARFLKKKMKDYGVTDAWSPDQNPNVNSGADRGHSHATEKIIQPGDVIQIDFGIKVFDRWVTDIQRFAYVLKGDEKKPPKDIQAYWENAKAGNRIALHTMKPGVKGVEVDRAQRKLMEKSGSELVMWSTGHPVGYVAHDIGPSLGGAQAQTPSLATERTLKEGMVFAFDGFHAWLLNDGSLKTISVEEMAVVTNDGAEYLIQPQEDLVLIK